MRIAGMGRRRSVTFGRELWPAGGVGDGFTRTLSLPSLAPSIKGRRRGHVIKSYEYNNAPGGICNGITGGRNDPDDIDFNVGFAVTGQDEDWRGASSGCRTRRGIYTPFPCDAKRRKRNKKFLTTDGHYGWTRIKSGKRKSGKGVATEWHARMNAPHRCFRAKTQNSHFSRTNPFTVETWF
jgi:hypothetical protein